MIEQIIALAQDPDFKPFTVLLSTGGEYEIPTREHVSIPPHNKSFPPDFFIVYAAKIAHIVSVANVASIKVAPKES